mgnify:CR=1 FL=1
MEIVGYTHTHRAACLKLFDLNCPEYFAPNERTFYESFLASGSAFPAGILLNIAPTLF